MLISQIKTAPYSVLATVIGHAAEGEDAVDTIVTRGYKDEVRQHRVRPSRVSSILHQDFGGADSLTRGEIDLNDACVPLSQLGRTCEEYVGPAAQEADVGVG